MLERWEVERAEEWRKRAKATARRARWRGEDGALRDAVNVKLAGKRRAGPWEDRTVGDLFNADTTAAQVDAGHPRLPRNPVEWSDANAYKLKD